jgi:hypothetical protein
MRKQKDAGVWRCGWLLGWVWGVLKMLLVRSQRLRLFVCHCEERMMQKRRAMNAT